MASPRVQNGHGERLRAVEFRPAPAQGSPTARYQNPAPFTVSAWWTSWVERARRPLWLYREMPGDRAWRTDLSLASTVHRPSWQASRASAARLPRPDYRSFSDALSGASDTTDSSIADAANAVNLPSFGIDDPMHSGTANVVLPGSLAK
jgi:hypothetical protein